jgi:distribution and morphology protein 12
MYVPSLPISQLPAHPLRLRRSIDLDWSSLDADLTASAISFLTTAFAAAPRPSFLGDITVTSFSFGECAPDVQILEIRDVYKQFAEVDDELEREQAEGGEASGNPNGERRASGATSGTATGLTAPMMGGDASESYIRGSPPSLRRAIPNPHPSSSLFSPGLNPSFPPSTACPPSPSPSSSLNAAPPSSSSSPSLQLHLQVTYAGNLSLSLSTSLQINYPAPLFMSLPLKLSLTSLAFGGTFVVAFEGDRRRVHLCVLDPVDEGIGRESSRRTTAGERLLREVVVESEVGQVDKHVLMNVGKVEKFVLEVVRGALENELVFP